MPLADESTNTRFSSLSFIHDTISFSAFAPFKTSVLVPFKQLFESIVVFKDE